MAKRKIFGQCRICGEEKKLTEEHYIPRAAGGGAKVKLYKGDELLKTLGTDKAHIPFGKIQQSGLSEYTLCKECNQMCGTDYDKDFSDFYIGVHRVLIDFLNTNNINPADDNLNGKKVTLEIVNIKPNNIAKRILASFCTIEHAGLTDRNPEIRKALLDKTYQPDTSSFGVYMSLHIGNSAFYATMAALKSVGNQYIVEAFSGIESELLAFYFSSDKDTISRGLLKCTNITDWLTNYLYDEVSSINLELIFNKSLTLRFLINQPKKS